MERAFVYYCFTLKICSVASILGDPSITQQQKPAQVLIGECTPQSLVYNCFGFYVQPTVGLQNMYLIFLPFTSFALLKGQHNMYHKMSIKSETLRLDKFQKIKFYCKLFLQYRLATCIPNKAFRCMNLKIIGLCTSHFVAICFLPYIFVYGWFKFLSLHELES